MIPIPLDIKLLLPGYRSRWRARYACMIAELSALAPQLTYGEDDGVPWIELEDANLRLFGFRTEQKNAEVYRILRGVLPPNIPMSHFRLVKDCLNRYLYPHMRPDLKPAGYPAEAMFGFHGQHKDAIADITLQQVLTRPAEFDVIATMNLNGDYLSDALAAQIGGIGIAPGGNINNITGHAVFEATHGTAPKYTDQDKVNPGSVILSGEMMLRYLGWTKAADLIIKAMEQTIGQQTVTYDFARLMDDISPVKCSEFGDALIKNM